MAQRIIFGFYSNTGATVANILVNRKYCIISKSISYAFC